MTGDQDVDALNGFHPDALPAGAALPAAVGREQLPAPALGVPVDFHGLIMPLEERKARILARLSATALEIGAELLAARTEHEGEFMAWVERELPFGIDKAERLMAISRSFAEVDPAVRGALPAAWTALYELQKLPPAALARSVDLGVVRPGMTVEQAKEHVREQLGARKAEEVRQVADTSRTIAEAHALALLRHYPSDITDSTMEALRSWLNG